MQFSYSSSTFSSSLSISTAISWLRVGSIGKMLEELPVYSWGLLFSFLIDWSIIDAIESSVQCWCLLDRRNWVNLLDVLRSDMPRTGASSGGRVKTIPRDVTFDGIDLICRWALSGLSRELLREWPQGAKDITLVLHNWFRIWHH